MARTCEVKGCEEPHSAHGFCRRHYSAWRMHGDPFGGRTYKPRRTEGPRGVYLPLVDVRPSGKGKGEWALDTSGQWWHYPYGTKSARRVRSRAEERICQQCGVKFLYRPTGARGDRGLYHDLACAGLAKKGEVRARGPESPNWKGGRHVRKQDGYVQIQMTQDDGTRPWQLEHRLIMEKKLGRKLTADETVHHKNGDRSDNRISNLELRIGRHGKGATEAHCATCTCFENT